MARKREIKKAAKRFIASVDALLIYTDAVSQGQTDAHKSLIFDGAVIKLYRLFEELMLDVLVGAVNQDTSTLSTTIGIPLPKHLSDEVCNYLLFGKRYFDFKGRSGLIQVIGDAVPDSHYFKKIVERPLYTQALNVLSALRNFAAHESDKSRKAALTATKQKRIGSAGAWLRRTPPNKANSRFEWLCSKLKELAAEIQAQAPR